MLSPVLPFPKTGDQGALSAPRALRLLRFSCIKRFISSLQRSSGFASRVDFYDEGRVKSGYCSRLGRGIKIGSSCILLCRSSLANSKGVGITVRAMLESRVRAGRI